jgi:hypothetical protein
MEKEEKKRIFSETENNENNENKEKNKKIKLTPTEISEKFKQIFTSSQDLQNVTTDEVTSPTTLHKVRRINKKRQK